LKRASCPKSGLTMAAEYKAELAVVIPVFNEEKTLVELLEDWQSAFRSIPVRYRFIIINDGSTDNSGAILQSMTERMPDIEFHTQANAGHGPAILAGYKMALGTDHNGQPGCPEWIFQIDSDHQHDPAAFALLWDKRKDYDFLLGERNQKNATLPRKGVSLLSTGVVRLLAGTGVKDVNSPYRLMRSSKLNEALKLVPGNSFAPNILLTSWFVFSKSRIFTTELGNRSEGIRRQSKMNFYFLKGCFLSIFQTILFRFRL
jgi:dolichol-phosphate mannosyltransferase